MKNTKKDRLEAVSAETMSIIDQGGYLDRRGDWVSLESALARQTRGNAYWPPESPLPAVAPGVGSMAISVVDEDAVTAILRLGTEPEPVCCLVFASARNPGGGFLNGADAQEESIARSSTLPKALLSTEQFYGPHRASKDLRYSDAAIYTPHSQIIRDRALRLVDRPVECTFITAAAPNASAIASNQAQDLGSIPAVFERRVRRVLHLAAAHGHRRLVLGAWGCGVFKNDPGEVAGYFRAALQEFGAFDEVVFAVPKGGADHHDIFAAALFDLQVAGIE